MALAYPPKLGTIVICEFDRYAILPEMRKRRPAVVISSASPGLCIVVPLSTTAPFPIEPWHYLLSTTPPLPPPYSSSSHWVKGDMTFPASLARLTLPFSKKNKDGKREYVFHIIDEDCLNSIRKCVASAFLPAEWLDKL